MRSRRRFALRALEGLEDRTLLSGIQISGPSQSPAGLLVPVDIHASGQLKVAITGDAVIQSANMPYRHSGSWFSFKVKPHRVVSLILDPKAATFKVTAVSHRSRVESTFVVFANPTPVAAPQPSPPVQPTSVPTAPALPATPLPPAPVVVTPPPAPPVPVVDFQTTMTTAATVHTNGSHSGTAIFDVQVVNNGPNTGTEVVTLNFPGAAKVSQAPAGSTVSGNQVMIARGSLPPGGIDNFSVTFGVTGSPGDTIVVTALASSPDAKENPVTEGDNIAQAQTILIGTPPGVIDQLTIGLTAKDLAVQAPDSVQLTFKMDNTEISSLDNVLVRIPIQAGSGLIVDTTGTSSDFHLSADGTELDATYSIGGMASISKPIVFLTTGVTATETVTFTVIVSMTGAGSKTSDPTSEVIWVSM